MPMTIRSLKVSHQIIIIKSTRQAPGSLVESQDEGIDSEIQYTVPHERTPEQVGQDVTRILKKIKKLENMDGETEA
jgi:hypothetical protein